MKKSIKFLIIGICSIFFSLIPFYFGLEFISTLFFFFGVYFLFYSYGFSDIGRNTKQESKK